MGFHPLFHIAAPAAAAALVRLLDDGDFHVQERRRRRRWRRWSGGVVVEADAAAPDHRQDPIARGRPGELRVNEATTVPLVCAHMSVSQKLRP